MPAPDPPFLVGVALSVYQNSGCGEVSTNWSEFEKRKNRLGQPTIEGGDVCGASNNFWDCYEDDIARAASLNSTSFRFSIEWSRIEPLQGQWDDNSVKRYHQIVDCLHRYKLEPMVTLHHFVHPTWFEDRGAFTKEENIPLFVSYCRRVFRLCPIKGMRFDFHAVKALDVTGIAGAQLWATFNEANVMSFCGWLWAQFPPGIFGCFIAAGKNLLNMLRAHTAAYRALKGMPGGTEAKIGLVHNFMIYEVLQPKAVSAHWVQPVVDWLRYIWATEILVEYFTTGRFSWKSPIWGRIDYQEPTLPGLDFIGLNYYGRVCIDWKFASTCHSGDTMTDMPFALYGPGLYMGISAVSELGVPIYITETGIADASPAGSRRVEFIETYFPEIVRAVRDGADVRGLSYWTLVDNFEWAHGFHQKFGLFKWSPGDGPRRMARPPTARLATAFAALPAQVADAKRQALQMLPRVGTGPGRRMELPTRETEKLFH